MHISTQTKSCEIILTILLLFILFRVLQRCLNRVSYHVLQFSLLHLLLKLHEGISLYLNNSPSFSHTESEEFIGDTFTWVMNEIHYNQRFIIEAI